MKLEKAKWLLGVALGGGMLLSCDSASSVNPKEFDLIETIKTGIQNACKLGGNQVNISSEEGVLCKDQYIAAFAEHYCPRYDPNFSNSQCHKYAPNALKEAARGGKDIFHLLNGSSTFFNAIKQGGGELDKDGWLK